MTAPIRSLPEDVVHLIAAGEVVDSLAAVVRELAENALDAGATRIAISVWANQWKVRVADNGTGMVLSDLQQAATAHSTSKIYQRQDLWHIQSLGFRGEALHSLAQLANLEICSRWADSLEGWWVQYDPQGNPVATAVAAIAPGTVVTVSNLFHSWLPRREGLPSPAQQLRALQATIHQLALCHPQVTWQVEQDDRPWFAIWAGETARYILPQLVRDIQPTDLQELNLAPSLYLLAGLPDRCHRHRPDWVRVAVNGRMVKAPELEQKIFAGFRRTLLRDRHPVCFVHLSLPPNQVDWNRHPAKSEIYLHQMEVWQEQVGEAIAQVLRLNTASLPAANHRVGEVLRAAESAGSYRSRPDPTELDITSPPTTLRAIAQVHQMYLLVEHPGGIWLLEQHIAHERVLYEQLRDRWQLVPLTTPILLSDLSVAQVEQLQRLGMELEAFGDRLWAVRTVPEPLSQRSDCADALIELSLGGDLEAALVATACRTAIRNGTPLTLPEMQTLLEQWQQTRNPQTCPHGRPICLSLEESSLSRFFRRHWVIGKSHGI